MLPYGSIDSGSGFHSRAGVAMESDAGKGEPKGRDGTLCARIPAMLL